MILPQTSLIPATISLLKFYQEFGFKSFSMNYPYWYLGEVPFKYLIGPITPIILNYDLLLNNLIYIILLIILFSAIGWSLFITSFFKENKFKILLLVFSFYLLTPYKYLSSWALMDFTVLFAKSLIPFFLLFLYKKKYILSVIVLTLILLINTSALPTIFIFSIALILKDYKNRLKSLLYIFLLSIFISCLWYGPTYYLRILMNPSIGGRMGVSVIFGVLNFFKIVLPVVLALIAVKFSGKLSKRLPIFITVSLLSFAVMTLYRFFANPNFWMDWITWFYELEISLSLLIAYAVYKKQYKYVFLVLFSFLTTFVFGSMLDLRNKYDTNILRELEKVAGSDRVFISGSTVFQPSRLNQLRGGRDEVTKNKDWLDASYLFRESQDRELITKNFRLLKIKYVLVHTKDSKEYYHDFKNEQVWGQIGQVVFEDGGDKIYKID